ncbi:hypothetical protein F3087_26765 [Nocardia colli]|uniref:Uncharacterized protein n=1 Tax=Nocardia colli TaxID=2545717 RepID=A0A5N0EDH9_9NOCA|nr:hypothetical protein [Nocardia colli]KAA8886195.1 hypothetical protein F3087_26765 [Nocardia colli]
MAFAMLVGLAVFMGGILLAGSLFGLAWAVLDLLDRGRRKVRVSDIQDRLSHEKPIRPLSVEQALAEEPQHQECNAARCHKKRAINRTLAAQRRQKVVGRVDSAVCEPHTDVSPIERYPEWPIRSGQ